MDGTVSARKAGFRNGFTSGNIILPSLQIICVGSILPSTGFTSIPSSSIYSSPLTGSISISSPPGITLSMVTSTERGLVVPNRYIFLIMSSQLGSLGSGSRVRSKASVRVSPVIFPSVSIPPRAPS